MRYMDRTKEFLQLVTAAAANKTLISPVKIPLPSTTPETSIDEQFSKLTNEVSNGFDLCKAEFSELDTLAKKRSLYEERSSEIQTRTLQIKTKLTSFSSILDQAEDLCRSLPSSGSPGSQHAGAHRQAVLSSLRSRLMDLTKELTQILQARSANLAKLDQRRNLYSGVARSNGVAPPPSSGSNLSLNRRTFAAANDPMGGAGPSNVVDLESGMQQQQLLVAPQSYHQSRTEAVEQIQRVVGELSTMFSRVAAMVGQQEEMVMRIDATVDDSLVRLREGQAHLLKYFDALVSQRSLILKLLGMLLAFAVFFIIFLA